VALYSLGTIAAYDVCKQQVQGEGFMQKLAGMAAGGGDRTTAKYASRVIDRVKAPGRK
jgi:hypothetical protein